MSTDVQEKIETNLRLKEPSMYRVVYLNDDQTSMQFVLDSLMKYFNFSVDEASEKMFEIHEQGAAVVGVFAWEIADQKGTDVVIEAKDQGFPLQVKIEPV